MFGPSQCQSKEPLQRSSLEGDQTKVLKSQFRGTLPSFPPLQLQAQQLLVMIWETGKFQKLSIIITFHPSELTLHLRYFCTQKKRQGREGLPVDCHIYGIISERGRLRMGEEDARWSCSSTLRGLQLGLQMFEVHFKNLLHK